MVAVTLRNYYSTRWKIRVLCSLESFWGLHALHATTAVHPVSGEEFPLRCPLKDGSLCSAVAVAVAVAEVLVWALYGGAVAARQA